MNSPIFLVAAISWSGVWLTPDQQGMRSFERGEFAAAAKAFDDPQWRGVALYRAGEFEEAARAFSTSDDAVAQFNQGNAWLMNGKYESAIACYDRALSIRADWKEALDNRALAVARAEKAKPPSGDRGYQENDANKTVFDKDRRNENRETEEVHDPAASHEQMQALWLRRVQTRPADFLKAKFAYQLEETGEEGDR